MCAASGTLTGDPLPSLQAYQIVFGDDTTTFSDPAYWSYRFGLITLEMPDVVFTENLDTIGVRFLMEEGDLAGQTSLPSAIDSLIVNVGDTLPLGASLRVEWPDADCDFVDLGWTYRWRDSIDYWHLETLDSFVVDGFIEFDTDAFPYDGEIRFYEVVPVNGPCPHGGARANMGGAGSGYLYYSNVSVRSQAYIIVGQGLFGGSTKTAPESHTSSRSVDRVREALLK